MAAESLEASKAEGMPVEEWNGSELVGAGARMTGKRPGIERPAETAAAASGKAGQRRLKLVISLKRQVELEWA